jgi:hypothetical protein
MMMMSFTGALHLYSLKWMDQLVQAPINEMAAQIKRYQSTWLILQQLKKLCRIDQILV